MTFISWYQVKLFVEHASGISMDTLHVIVGVAIFLIAARLLKRSAASMPPWLATLCLELGNEAYDLTVERWPNLGQQLGEGFKDILLTMALPTLLLLVARYRPALLVENPDLNRSGDDDVADRADVGLACGAAPRLDDQGQAHGKNGADRGGPQRIVDSAVE